MNEPKTISHARRTAVTRMPLSAAAAAMPLLPTTPFLLVAAWAGGKGWPQLEAWLVAHPRWGPPITRWPKASL